MGLISGIRSTLLDDQTGGNYPDQIVKGGEDDKELLKKFNTWWNESSNLYDERLQWVKLNRALYRGEHIKKERPRHRSRVVHNKIFENVDSYEEKMTKNMPEPITVVDNDDPETLEAARIAYAMLMNLHRSDQMQLKTEKIGHNMLIDRDAVVLMRWNTKKGALGDVETEIVEPEHCRISPNSTPFEISDYFFIAPPRTYKEVLEMYPNEREHILESFGVSEQEVSQDDADQKKTENLLPLKEVWYWKYNEKEQRFDAWQAVYLKDKILSNMINPYWDFDGELSPEDQVRYEKTMRDIEEGVVINEDLDVENRMNELDAAFKNRRVFRNFLECQEFPIVIIPTFISTTSPWSETSFIEQVASLQMSLNNMKQSIEENAQMVGKGRIVKDSNCGISNNQITNAGGAIYTVTPGSRFEIVQGTPLPEQFFDNMADSETAIDNVFGANDISKGMLPSPNTPVRTSIIAKEADQGRVAKIIRKLEYGLERIYRWQMHLMKLYYTEERTIMMADNYGNPEGFMKVTNDNIPDGMQLYVKTGSAQPRDIVEEEAKYMAMFQNGQIDPITFFSKIRGFDDPERQAEMLWKWQQGTLFQPPQIGPEEEARQNVEALQRGEIDKIPVNPAATLESVAVYQQALADKTRGLTDDQISALEEVMQIELQQIEGKRSADRATMRSSMIPPDIAAQNMENPEAQAALEQAAALGQE